MYEIKADTDRNLLLVRLGGFMSDDEIRRGSAVLLEEADKLKKGFAVINDISELKPATTKGSEIIKNTQKSVVDKGAKKIIRVTKNAITKMQFNRTSKEAGYAAYEANTFEEALLLV